mmetsp:Transcript_70395/g.147393  ORF Transcript_70395/g.147393 Transcript_70395/m.147393 type:complete len:399 (+) Transcript_70395:404-1600(+)
MECFHDPAHTCAGDTTTSEDLNGVVGDQVADPCHGVLQERNPASQQRTLGALLAHAVGDLVLKRGDGFQGREHLRQLLPDHGLFHELGAEDFALHGPLEGLLGALPGTGQVNDADHPSFVVKVGHDDLETLALLAEQALRRHNSILVGDEDCACGTGVLGLDFAANHLVGLRHENHRNPSSVFATRSHGSDKPVGILSSSDPFFGARNHVVFARGILLRSGADRGDIAAGIGLSDGEAGHGVTHDERGQHFLLHPLVAVLEDNRDRDGVASLQAVLPTRAEVSHTFLLHDHLVEVIEFLGLHNASQQATRDQLQVLTGAKTHGSQACSSHLLSDLLARAIHGLLAFEGIVDDLWVSHELAHRLAQGVVRLVEVRKGKALEDSRLGEGHLAKLLGFLQR